MKFLALVFGIFPALSFAGLYSCNGSGFSIDVSANPVEMRISGNGFNSTAQNVRYSATFDTVVAGNITTPAATVKLTIKDSSFGNPGDSFGAAFQVSSAAGIKDFTNITCVRGND
jgi:hypothetical protein